MPPESKHQPTQPDLFANEPTKPEVPAEHDEKVEEVDRVNLVARIMEDGYVLKCVLRDGEIHIGGVEGATSLKEVPLPVQARAIKKAWAILGPEVKP